jgi:UDP-2-acetamido-3-amino-2,3-dideoxy-glucuronate N-acetyltransferase
MTATDVGIAVLGAGPFGSNHIRVWRELGCLRVVVDTCPAARAEVASRWPDIETTADLDETLARTDVTAVVVATPAATHASLAIQAIAAGKDVLVEKPMALDEHDAARIVETSERLGRVVAVGHLLEHHPAVTALLGLIENGAFGELRYVYSNRLNIGRIRTGENALWSFAPHDVDLICRIMGSAPEKVSCRGGAYVSPGMADMAVAAMTFADGRLGHIFVSWLHPFKEHRLVVVGDKQMAVFDDTATWDQKLVLYPHRMDRTAGTVPIVDRAEGSPVPLTAAEPLKLECVDFLESIRNSRRPRVDARRGQRVVAILAAAQRSLDAAGAPALIGDNASDAVQIHPTAWVHPSARIGRGTKVWHHSTVLEGACIGENSMLGQNTFVGRNVRIGCGARIQNNVSVYEGVELDDDVFCGPSVVFTNVERPRAHVDRAGEFMPTRIGRGATLGANSTIVCGVSIGRYAFVAAGAVVSRDVPDHAVVIGVRARQSGWACFCGEKLVTRGDFGRCERCATQFVGCESGVVTPIKTTDDRFEGRLA